MLSTNDEWQQLSYHMANKPLPNIEFDSQFLPALAQQTQFLPTFHHDFSCQ